MDLCSLRADVRKQFLPNMKKGALSNSLSFLHAFLSMYFCSLHETTCVRQTWLCQLMARSWPTECVAVVYMGRDWEFGMYGLVVC